MKAASKRPECRESGLTLLEVMVALALISLSLTVLIYSNMSSYELISTATNHSRAVIVAKNVMSNIDIDEKVPNSSFEGKEDVGGVVFSWESSVDPSPIKFIAKVSVKVSWGKGNDYFTLESYRML